MYHESGLEVGQASFVEILGYRSSVRLFGIPRLASANDDGAKGTIAE